MNQNAAVDTLVLEYLEKRGLTATTKQLRSESQAFSQQPMSLAPNRGLTGAVSDLLFYLAADGNPSQYARSFDSLAAWVDNSLDSYRHELSQVLYPVFIHCCLLLVKNGAARDAGQLLSRHSQRFRTVGGQPSKLRMQELNELQALSMPEQLTTNRVAQAAAKTRFPVCLCLYSYQLLMHYLEGAHLHLILGIVNDRLAIQVEEGLPKGIADAPETETSLLIGEVEAGAADANLSEINLSLLEGLAEDKVATAKAAELALEIPETDETGRPLTKKERTARQRAATRERDALLAAESTRMEPEIPLPPLAVRTNESQLADVKARVDLDAGALPSAALFTFVNTHQSLNCCAFSQDGAMVAGGFADASVRIYDMQKAAETAGGPGPRDGDPGAETTILRGHSGAVYGADFSPDAQLLFTAAGDGTLRLWHLPLQACLNSYRGHIFPVWDVAANPHGHYFASVGADRTGRVWSVERNRPLRILAGHHADAGTVAWHPNGHFVATGSSDHTVRLWDVRDGAAQRVLIGHRAPVSALAFHPDGTRAASADDDGAVICWDLVAGRRLAGSERPGGAPVWSLAYSRGEGNLLASGCADDCIRLWDAANPGPDGELAPLKTLRTKATPVFRTHFTPRNLLLAAGSLTLPRRQAA